ncbi:MAG: phosphate ABC transporter permease PstA [Bacteroidetes bacterium]|nr:phosphate ABC transporter, permease protein PstA [Saprospirales bacterium]RMD99155.1 MAG: phosphate ABC transporter permease PstA [Bacteroidota bacterium]
MNSIKWNRFLDKAFQVVGIASTLIGLVLLAFFIGSILDDGLKRINLDFLTSLPSRKPEKAGILTAWAGTLWIFGLTALISIPLGVSAGIYLEEYARKGRLSNILEVNITNLAGVPSVIYGILGLEIFARTMNLGGSLLTGALTLSLLILPIIIVATREAIKAVPNSIREASYGMGATRWQTMRHTVLPAAGGGIATGIILALSRAVGEAAPLIVVGALAYVPFTPKTPMDDFTVLPIQIFNWTSRPDPGFIINAAAGIIILLGITFLLNGIAVWLRYRWQKKVNW